jgi:hypothetical protein
MIAQGSNISNTGEKLEDIHPTFTIFNKKSVIQAMGCFDKDEKPYNITIGE